MRTRKIIVALCLFMLATLGKAQVVPSTLVPMGGSCILYDSRPLPDLLAAGSTTYFKARGSCGVPTDATAVAVNVIVANATGNGRLSVFDSGLLPDTVYEIMNFTSAAEWRESLIVRPCYPSEECSNVDLGIKLWSASADVIIVAQGYFIPLPE